MVAVLGVISAYTPIPRNTDSDLYQHLGRQVLIRDCNSIHCARVLVAVVLEHLPGPTGLKWKAYAAVANSVAALAVARFCLLLGVTAPAAIAASWICALGFGSLYTLYDTYTSDPLMYMLGPLIAVAVWQGRIGRAGLLGGVGVFAKEFAAAPLWIFTLLAALERRWRAARQLLGTAVVVTLIWLSTQLALRTLLNYSYGESASVDLWHGAYLALWLQGVHFSGALTYLFTTFSALYLLLPVGLALSRCNRNLALASLPAAAAFMYVEQPERALWNFHFIVIPIAVQVLQALPRWAMVAFAVSFGILNLRIGAQLPLQTPARVCLVVSLAIAAVAAIVSLSRMSRRPTPLEPIS